MARLALVALVAILPGIAGPALSQAPTTGPLPTGEAVISKYVEATGGAAAYEAIKNRVTRARIEIVGTGVTISTTTYQARPDRSYTIAQGDAIGRIESGVSDGVAWEKSSMRGAVVKEGQERDDAVREATFDRLFNFRSQHRKIECVGQEVVEGKECFKVVVTPNVGSAQTACFDRDSGLVVRIEGVVVVPQGTFPVVSFPSDYRQVAGSIRMPFKNTLSVAGQTRITTVESIEQNVDLPADRFALPAEIKALVKYFDVPD